MEYEKKYKEAQKWIESIYSELSHEQQMEAEAFFPELKESEDEKIRKEIIELISCMHDADPRKERWIAWLEKQGEQKPASKVEPKFKVGDWIVTSYGNVNQVVAVDKDGDGFTLDDDTYFCGSWKDSFHLWTIQDANDGDVLVCPIPKTYDSAGQIFMFKGINSRTYVDNCIEFYCRVHEGVFYENENGYGYMGTTSSPIYPATKEQRETLIKAMTDAGYTFDFEKKELKKIAPSNKELEGKV